MYIYIDIICIYIYYIYTISGKYTRLPFCHVGTSQDPGEKIHGSGQSNVTKTGVKHVWKTQPLFHRKHIEIFTTSIRMMYHINAISISPSLKAQTFWAISMADTVFHTSFSTPRVLDGLCAWHTTKISPRKRAKNLGDAVVVVWFWRHLRWRRISTSP